MTMFCTGTARIQHNHTGAIYEVESSELEWNEEGVGEGSMGSESEHRAVVEHAVLGPLVWTLGEYPTGIEDHRETNVGAHKLLSNVEYRLAHEPEPREGA